MTLVDWAVVIIMVVGRDWTEWPRGSFVRYAR